MTADPTLFDGAELRDRGVALVGAAEPEWSEKAATCIRTLAEYLPEFTADDLRDAIGDPPRLNLMGAVFLRAHKAGLITLVGYRASKRRERHANRVAVWRGVGS